MSIRQIVTKADVIALSFAILRLGPPIVLLSALFPKIALAVPLEFDSILDTAWKNARQRKVLEARREYDKDEMFAGLTPNLPEVQAGIYDELRSSYYSQADALPSGDKRDTKNQIYFEAEMSYPINKVWKSQQDLLLLGEVLKSRDFDEEELRRNIQFEVAQIFVDYVSSRKTYLQNKKLVALMNDKLDTLKKVLSYGSSIKVAQLKVEFALQQSLLFLQKSRNEVGKNQIKLSKYLGIPLSQIEDEIDISFFDESLILKNDSHIFDAATVKLSKEKQLMQELEVVSGKLKRQDLDKYPEVAGFANVNWLASPGPYEAKSQGAIGVKLTWELDNHIRRQRKTLALGKEKLLITEQLVNLRESHKLDAEEYFKTMELLKSLAIDSARYILAARKVLEGENERLLAGEGRLEWLIDGQLDFFSSMRDLVDVTRDYIKAFLGFQYAIGQDRLVLKGTK